MQDYSKLVQSLRLCQKDDGCESCAYKKDMLQNFCWLEAMSDAADAIEAMVKMVNSAELQIKEYKGEADLYKDLYRSAHEAFLKELYGTHGTLANLQSLMQSPIPCNPCPNRAEDLYNLCANHPEKPDCSENPNG